MPEKEKLLLIISNPKLRNTDKLLLFYLLITSTGGQINVSNGKISEEIGVSKIAIIKSLQKLNKIGLIHRELMINPNLNGNIGRRITLIEDEI